MRIWKYVATKISNSDQNQDSSLNDDQSENQLDENSGDEENSSDTEGVGNDYDSGQDSGNEDDSNLEEDSKGNGSDSQESSDMENDMNDSNSGQDSGNEDDSNLEEDSKENDFDKQESSDMESDENDSNSGQDFGNEDDSNLEEDSKGNGSDSQESSSDMGNDMNDSNSGQGSSNEADSNLEEDSKGNGSDSQKSSSDMESQNSEQNSHNVNGSNSQEISLEIENPDADSNNEQGLDQETDLNSQKEELRAMKNMLEEMIEQEDQLAEENTSEYTDDYSNQFLKRLEEIPSFEQRQTSDGYSIDTQSNTEIPDSLVRTLITKFLNQRFCIRTTDLNVRSNSLEKSYGFYKWNVKDVIVDSKTHQLNKVLHDKYGYDYADGKNENVPLSFYFDMSSSMSKYTNMLAVISIELLKKGVKVLIGFNSKVNVQIDSIASNIDVSDLVSFLKKAGESDASFSTNYIKQKKDQFTFKTIKRELDTYLIDKRAEKCVIFSDFDPRIKVINLSNHSQVYWFCFEKNFSLSSLSTYGKKFQGFLYPVQNQEDLALGLVKINEKRFEALCYVDNIKVLQKEYSK